MRGVNRTIVVHDMTARNQGDDHVKPEHLRCAGMRKSDLCGGTRSVGNRSVRPTLQNLQLEL
jgi:hypothetical protein